MARGRKKAETPDVDGNVGKAAFLEAYDLVKEKLRLKKEADSALGNAYRAAERNGIDKKELKRAIAAADLSAEERAISDRKHRLYLAWLGLPIGTQAEMEMPAASANGHVPDPAEAEAVQRHENSEAYEWGLSAGLAGAAAESLPYTPGTEEHQSAHSGWIEGQRRTVSELGGATHRA